MRTLLTAFLLGSLGANSGQAQVPLAADKPDFSGIWRRVGYQPAALPDGGKPLPLLPAAAATLAAHQAAASRGDRSHDLSALCLPEGLPRLMLKAEPFEVLQRPGFLAFNYQINRLSRLAYIGEAPPEENNGFYLGESTARWEGDSLVIDTRGFNDQTLLDDAGLPHSDALVLTERLQLSKEGRELVNQITVQDPRTFSAAWTITVRYERLKDFLMPEDVCADRLGSTAPRDRRTEP
ncbi:MAG: hypothetical protein RL026_2445 [Pseudomonadota bacterium]|jgi:hypothetical protein